MHSSSVNSEHMPHALRFRIAILFLVALTAFCGSERSYAAAKSSAYLITGSGVRVALQSFTDSYSGQKSDAKAMQEKLLTVTYRHGKDEKNPLKKALADKNLKTIKIAIVPSGSTEPSKEYTYKNDRVKQISTTTKSKESTVSVIFVYAAFSIESKQKEGAGQHPAGWNMGHQ